jgi:serine/threonine protein kinase
VSCCINPWCSNRINSLQAENCSACQTPLIINGRFRLTEALTDLSSDRKSDVYVAVDLQGSNLVEEQTERVLKVCKSSDPKVIELFEREVATLQYLDCPEIPKCHLDDFFIVKIPGYPLVMRCLVMDRIPGQNLDQWLSECGPVSQDVAIRWLGQFAEILDYLHGEGYIHRDISLSNTMVMPSGDVAIIDFGTVRKITDTYFAKISPGCADQLTRVETFGFTAPEQLVGRALPQSDFYALGRVFICLLTGKYPHEIETDNEYRLQWEQETKGIDKPLLKLINSLVDRNISKRPLNTAQLLSIVGYSLPQQIKKRRIFNNKYFRLTSIFLSSLLIVGLIYGFLGYASDRSYISARAQKDAQEWNRAKASFEQSIRLRPRAESYNQLGEVCYKMQDVVCAEQSFQKAIALRPTQVEGYMHLANLYEDTKNFEKARETYQTAINRAKGHPGPQINLSRLYIRSGNLEEAEALARQSLQTVVIDGYSLARLYKNLAWLYLVKKDYSQAKFHAETAISLDSYFVSPYCILALAHEQLNLALKEQLKKCATQSGEDQNYPEVKAWRIELINQILDKR